jgi:hypothetical protein
MRAAAADASPLRLAWPEPRRCRLRCASRLVHGRQERYAKRSLHYERALGILARRKALAPRQCEAMPRSCCARLPRDGACAGAMSRHRRQHRGRPGRTILAMPVVGQERPHFGGYCAAGGQRSLGALGGDQRRVQRCRKRRPVEQSRRNPQSNSRHSGGMDRAAQPAGGGGGAPGRRGVRRRGRLVREQGRRPSRLISGACAERRGLVNSANCGAAEMALKTAPTATDREESRARRRQNSSRAQRFRIAVAKVPPTARGSALS